MKKFGESAGKQFTSDKVRITLPLLGWLGGAFWVSEQPGMGFWDGVVWFWYVGRYVAQHFTALH